jgi:hypothetical protein
VILFKVMVMKEDEIVLGVEYVIIRLGYAPASWDSTVIRATNKPYIFDFRVNNETVM